jgi:hypothetical protein
MQRLGRKKKQAKVILVHLHNPVFTNQKKALSLQDKTKRHGSHEGIVEDAVTRRLTGQL